MAVKIIANYSKRLGLPGYSSHQFSVSVEVELNNTDDVKLEASRLYQALQTSVDREIQHTGFVPDGEYGAKNTPLPKQNTNGGDHSNSHSNGHHLPNGHANNGSVDWQCTPKQQELILKIVKENNLGKDEVEQLANEMFGHGVKALNRLAASGLIDELIERYPRRNRTHTNGPGNVSGYRRNGHRQREAA